MKNKILGYYRLMELEGLGGVDIAVYEDSPEDMKANMIQQEAEELGI